MAKLDYTIESPEERKKLVEQIIQETPDITPAYLEVLADYLVSSVEKQERKEKKILTDNRMATVTKRERSLEGLMNQFESGEDGVYNLFTEDKNVIFRPKISITASDLESIPPLAQLRQGINQWEEALKKSSGRQAYMIKKALIEMRKDQYIIKQAYQKPMIPCHLTHSTRFPVSLDDTSYMTDDGKVVIQGVSLMSPKVVSAILCNYSRLKEDSYDQFDGDTWYLMQAFDELCDKALKDYPIFERIVELKVDRVQNKEIREILSAEFDKTYTVEYISALWRKKIPKRIATVALEDYITWQYKKRGLPMKKCSRCGQIKPAHNAFFSINYTGQNGWYSICKACRNKKRGGD